MFIIFTIKLFAFEKEYTKEISKGQVTEQTGPETRYLLDPSRMPA